MGRIVVFSDGPRELKHMWLAPSGPYDSDNGFWWMWRHWVWFDLNADYGAKWWGGSVKDGFLMAWRHVHGPTHQETP